MAKHIGEQTILFEKDIHISETSSIVGTKEGNGPLKDYFDVILQDNLFGEETWEKAESKIVCENFKNLLVKSRLACRDIDYIVTGDLLNQCCGSSYGIKELNIPFFGVFGACSTMGEAMSLGAVLIESGGAERIIAGASSHFCSAEKQFRFPLELGNQRPPSSTWTVTGDGAALLTGKGRGPLIKAITTGKIVDYGITDANNMGAAMSPAAADVIYKHFKDTGRKPNYYDLIITGDLGYIGRELTIKLLQEKGINLGENYKDCGIEIYSKEMQDTHSGGSGCACSAVTFAGVLYNKLKKKELNKILFVPTGALMNTTSVQQGENICGIAHALDIENEV